jgi:hypothetical protein
MKCAVIPREALAPVVPPGMLVTVIERTFLGGMSLEIPFYGARRLNGSIGTAQLRVSQEGLWLGTWIKAKARGIAIATANGKTHYFWTFRAGRVLTTLKGSLVPSRSGATTQVDTAWAIPMATKARWHLNLPTTTTTPAASRRSWAPATDEKPHFRTVPNLRMHLLPLSPPSSGHGRENTASSEMVREGRPSGRNRGVSVNNATSVTMLNLTPLPIAPQELSVERQERGGTT